MPKQVLKISVTSKGKNPTQWFREITDSLHFEVQESVLNLSELCASRMQQIIKSSGYKLGDLANTINVEILNTVAGIEVGVGNISKLPFYWQMFNDGFKPGASNKFVPLGAFPDGKPDSSKSGGRWQVGAGNWTFFDNSQIKKPVRPLLYVDLASDEFRANIGLQIDRILRKERGKVLAGLAQTMGIK